MRSGRFNVITVTDGMGLFTNTNDIIPPLEHSDEGTLATTFQ
jgi:hypothetical protein